VTGCCAARARAKAGTDRFPWSGGTNLRAILEKGIETRELPVNEQPYRTALELAGLLDGRPRNPKMHPCGVVLTRQPVHELSPTFVSNKGWPTTHYDMDITEAIGLVKMDILAQGGLAVLRDAKVAIRRNQRHRPGCPRTVGRSQSVGSSPGGSRAVHHIESRPY
jgi:DNA polymerase III alpha subunit